MRRLEEYGWLASEKAVLSISAQKDLATFAASLALVKFSPGQQLVLNGLFTLPSWVLRGTGIAALHSKEWPALTCSQQHVPLVLIWTLLPAAFF